jgi:hypothetical protein
MLLTIEAFGLLCVILDFPLERPQNRQMVITQQAENRQMLLIRPSSGKSKMMHKSSNA